MHAFSFAPSASGVSNGFASADLAFDSATPTTVKISAQQAGTSGNNIFISLSRKDLQGAGPQFSLQQFAGGSGQTIYLINITLDLDTLNVAGGLGHPTTAASLVSAMAAQTIPPSSPPGSPSIASLISAIISPNGDPNADVATTSTPASFTAVQLTGGSDTPGATNNLDFDFDDGNALWVYWNGNGNNAIRVGEAGALTDGNWHHIALTRQGTTFTAYADGAILGSTD